MRDNQRNGPIKPTSNMDSLKDYGNYFDPRHLESDGQPQKAMSSTKDNSMSVFGGAAVKPLNMSGLQNDSILTIEKARPETFDGLKKKHSELYESAKFDEEDESNDDPSSPYTEAVMRKVVSKANQ